jgi:hypothetical protein
MAFFMTVSLISSNFEKTMSAVRYPISTDDNLTFYFTSEGPKGKIEKVVKFEQFAPETFNLGFCDRKSVAEDFDDHTISNNGDIRKVLATVIQTIALFFEHYPDMRIYVEGADDRRRRLYERILKQYRIDFEEEYRFWGGNGFSIEPFQNENTYEFLLISKRKKS